MFMVEFGSIKQIPKKKKDQKQQQQTHHSCIKSDGIRSSGNSHTNSGTDTDFMEDIYVPGAMPNASYRWISPATVATSL